MKVDGYRSDHMALSPDGRRLLVSASTASTVHVIDTERGHRRRLCLRRPATREQLLRRRRADLPSPDERFAYLQLSFLHGFVEFDLRQGKPTRIASLPISEAAERLPRELYVLDSAHHGIAMNPQGTKLCVAGTMSDYAAIVRRDTFAATVLDSGRKPYWATNSADGRHCFVSASGDDQVAVISYAEERVVATIPVGDHPQRMRTGVMRAEYLPPVVDAEAPRVTRARVRRTAAGRVLRMTLSEDARVRVVVQRAGARGRFRTLRILRRDGVQGAVALRLGRLPRGGLHRISVSATDGARNRSARTRLRFRVRG